MTAAAGLLAVLLDLVGGSGPPRFIPAAMLLAGAAITAGSSRPAAGRLPPPATVAAAVGLTAHMPIGLLIPPLGLGVPDWAILVLLIAWAALLALAVHQRRTRPLLFLAAPVATAALTAGKTTSDGRAMNTLSSTTGIGVTSNEDRHRSAQPPAAE